MRFSVLVRNARLGLALGFCLGLMEGCAPNQDVNPPTTISAKRKSANATTSPTPSAKQPTQQATGGANNAGVTPPATQAGNISANGGQNPNLSSLGSLISTLIGNLTGSSSNNGGQVGPNPSNPSSTPSPGASSQGSGDLRTLCQQTINNYRATIGASALALNNGASSCSDSQTGRDGQVSQAHANFGACQEMAQDECPGWDASNPSQALTSCLQMMWAEGPGGGHYENMSNKSYRSVSCGFNADNGSLWMVQNFYQ